MLKRENLLQLLCNLQPFHFETDHSDFNQVFLNPAIKSKKIIHVSYNSKEDKLLFLNFILQEFIAQQDFSSLIVTRPSGTATDPISGCLPRYGLQQAKKPVEKETLVHFG